MNTFGQAAIRALRALGAIFYEVFRLYFAIGDQLIRLAFPKAPTIKSILVGEEDQSIDDRLGKLEVARRALTESLSAIDELKAEAEKNKKELSVALEKISQLTNEKGKIDQEIRALREIAKLDTDAVRAAFRVPSERAIMRERVFGLVGGVVASLLAAGIWWVMTHLSLPK